MPALRYSEDTEFNDALRARGILPPLPVEPSDSPPSSPRPEQPQDLVERLDSSQAIDELDLDDEIPASLVDSWKSARLAQLRHADQITGARSAGLRPIGKEDYIREVNQASEVDVDPTSPRAEPGTGVAVCLWNSSPASNHLLSLLEQLSSRYPSTHFLTIPGASCIDNYPDANQPTLICYRRGTCLRQYVGIGSPLAGTAPTNGRLRAGLSATVADLEAELMAIGILDEHLRVKATKEDASDDDESGSEGGLSRRRKAQQGKSIRSAEADDSGSELDI